MYPTNEKKDGYVMETKDRITVEKIRKSYEEKTPTKLDELKALNSKVNFPPRLFAYIFGTLGALVLGLGMCLAMGVIGDAMILGIAIGTVGIAMVSVNYTIFCTLLESRKRKYAKDIIALSDEILK